MFICTNQKQNDKPCCANQNAQELLEYAKKRAKELGLTKELQFRISSSGCMGRCADGPILVIYPQSEWHTYKSENDIDQILNKVAQDLALELNSSPSETY